MTAETSGTGHAPSLNEVELVFTDTPEAAVAEGERHAAMAGATARLQTGLQTHIRESAGPAPEPEAFDLAEGGPNA
jgi:hypothetical protein